MELVLGTAQLGMNYGINNTVGKPSMKEAFKMLDTAYNNGIKTLDTAIAYGNSELIIGEYMHKTKEYFKIATKLPKLDSHNDIKETIEENINKSLEHLKISSLDYYFLHDFCNFKEKSEIIDVLKGYQRDGKISNIGVSLYDTDELNYILTRPKGYIDIVQIPFNVFDLRWIEDSLLERVKEKGIRVFSRSTYLQGLFFLSKGAANMVHPKAYNYIKVLSQFANKVGIKVDELAMQFVKSYKDIDFMLIGCETVEQFKRNIDNYNVDCAEIQTLSNKFVLDNFRYVEKEIIDPRLWK